MNINEQMNNWQQFSCDTKVGGEETAARFLNNVSNLDYTGSKIQTGEALR